jgi:nucleoside diphosphate kinase
MFITENTIEELAKIVGPVDLMTARSESTAKFGSSIEAQKQWTVRAVFAKDDASSAVRVSDSRFSAEREISFFFPGIYPCVHPLECSSSSKSDFFADA